MRRWLKERLCKLSVTSKTDIQRIQLIEPLEPRLLLSGTTYVVNSLDDVVSNDGQLTLREAIEASNSNASVNEAPAGSADETDLIMFDATLFDAGEQTLVLNGSELLVEDDVEIQGPDPTLLTIDGDGRSRVFRFSGEQTNATLSGVTVTGGRAVDLPGDDRFDEYGGGIRSAVSLTIDGVFIIDNQAINGGGLFLSSGDVVISNSLIKDNESTDGNTQTGGGGGIYHSASSLTISNSEIRDNESEAYGGGIRHVGGMINIEHTLIDGNDARYAGGGIYAAWQPITITDSVISNNYSNSQGGGLYNQTDLATVRDSVFRQNRARFSGGGIYNNSDLMVVNSLFEQNVSDASGGAIYVDIFNEATIINSVLNGNLAKSGNGGGIINRNGTLTVVNTNISGNQASGRGGGIYLEGDARDMRVTSSTIAANIANSGAGIFNEENVEFEINNTIVALNQGGDFEGPSSGSNNLISTDPGFVRIPTGGSDGWGDNPDTSGDESANDNYGDLRLNIASLAVNRGANTLALDHQGNPIEYDLNGDVRIYGEVVDIGAFELQVDVTNQLETPSTFVTTIEDVSNPFDQVISLREAILHAAFLNEDITFHPSLANQIFLLEQGELTISEPVTIDASSVGGITIDADGDSGIFVISGGLGTHTRLIGLTLTGGNRGNGGAIHVSSRTVVSVIDSTITRNRASSDGGGIYNANGTFRIVRSTISSNWAGSDGGGIFSGGDRGNIDVDSSKILGNRASTGGGIYNQAAINNSSHLFTLNNSIVVGNVATGRGGGIYSYGQHSQFDLSNSTVTANEAGTEGSGVWTGGSRNLDEFFVRNVIVALNVNDDYRGATKRRYGLFPLNGDPMFVRNPNDGGDGWIDNPDTSVDEAANNNYGDLRLRVGSPAIDMGETDRMHLDQADLDGDGDTSERLPYDLDDNLRVVGDAVDLGAYEFGSAPEIEVVQGGQLVRSNITTSAFGVHVEGDPAPELTFFLNNTGATDLILGELFLDDDSAFEISQQPASMVSGYASTSFKIRLLTDNPGMHSTRVQFTTNDSNENPFRIMLEGLVQPVTGTHYVVDSLEDVVAADGLLTLREAILAANTNLPVFDAPLGSPFAADQITFSPALFTEGAQTLLLNGTSLEIEDSLMITGPGTDLLTIDGDQTSRVFYIDMGTPEVELNAMTLSGGYTTGSGAAIWNFNTDLALTNVMINNNTSEISGAGLYNVEGHAILIEVDFVRNKAPQGGAIDNDASGRIDMVNTAFYGNVVSNNGGAIRNAGQMTLTNAVLSGNQALSGGAISVATGGSLTLYNSTISGNTGIIGGGIYSNGGTVTVNNSIVSLNDGTVNANIYDTGTTTLYESIVDNDPMFIRNAFSGPDGIWGTDDDDYGNLRLQPGSSAIDMGGISELPSDMYDLDHDNSTSEYLPRDHDRQFRVLGQAVDIGAYEFHTSPVRVSELHYHPAGTESTEFVELINVEDSPLNLAGMKLYIDNELAFEFDTTNDAILQAGEQVVIVGNKSVFTAQHPEVPPKYIADGELLKTLDNQQAEIALHDISNIPFQVFTYRSQWHSSTNGYGPSLTVVDPRAESGSWNDAESWYASGIDHGTPGRSDPTEIARAGDFNFDGQVDMEDLMHLAMNFGKSVKLEPGSDVRWQHGDANHDGTVNLIDLAILATNYGESGATGFSTTPLSTSQGSVDGAIMSVNSSTDEQPEKDTWDHIENLLDTDADVSLV